MNAKDGVLRLRTAGGLSNVGRRGTLGQVTRRYQPDFHRQGRSSPIRLIG
jgi:hypothetical protein